MLKKALTAFNIFLVLALMISCSNANNTERLNNSNEEIAGMLVTIIDI